MACTLHIPYCKLAVSETGKEVPNHLVKKLAYANTEKLYQKLYEELKSEGKFKIHDHNRLWPSVTDVWQGEASKGGSWSVKEHNM